MNAVLDSGVDSPSRTSHHDAVAHLIAVTAGVQPHFRLAISGAQEGCFSTEFFPRDGIRDAAALAVEWAIGGANVYVGSGLYTAATAARLARQGRRGGAADVAGTVGVCFDVDVDDETLAREILRGAGLDPCLVVHSGGGIHVWILLDRPLMFTSAAARNRWTSIVRAVWEAVDAVVRDTGVTDRFRGGKLDSTFDLARVLRLPGTLNCKQTPPRPVRLLDAAGPRVTAERLTEVAASRLRSTPTRDPSGAAAIGPTRPVAETIDRIMPKVELACVADADVDRTWRGDRPDLADPSPSGLDLALASRLAAAGWLDRDVADAIVARRAEAGDNLEKVTRRRDYLARTVAVAKAHRESRGSRSMTAADVRNVVSNAARTEAQR